MGFFSKIGKALGGGLKAVAKVVGKVAAIAAPIVSVVPGIGTAIGAGLSVVSGVLGPKPDTPAAASVQDISNTVGSVLQQFGIIPPPLAAPHPASVASAPAAAAGASPASSMSFATVALVLGAFLLLK